MAEEGRHSEEALALVPRLRDDARVRVAESGLAEVEVPNPKTRWFRVLAFIFRLPPVRIVALDEAGTWTLAHIDGKRTFGEIARLLAEEKGLEGPVAERSLAAFLNTLADRRVIVFERC